MRRTIVAVLVVAAACGHLARTPVRTATDPSSSIPQASDSNRCMNADSAMNGDSGGFCPWPGTTVVGP